MRNGIKRGHRENFETIYRDLCLPKLLLYGMGWDGMGWEHINYGSVSLGKGKKVFVE